MSLWSVLQSDTLSSEESSSTEIVENIQSTFKTLCDCADDARVFVYCQDICEFLTDGNAILALMDAFADDEDQHRGTRMDVVAARALQRIRTLSIRMSELTELLSERLNKDSHLRRVFLELEQLCTQLSIRVYTCAQSTATKYTDGVIGSILKEHCEKRCMVLLACFQ